MTLMMTVIINMMMIVLMVIRHDDADDGDGVDGARGAEIDVSENLARWAFGRNGLALGLEVIHIRIYKYMHVYVFTVRFNKKQWFNQKCFHR